MCGSSTQESSGPYDNIIFFLAPVRTNDALFVHISDSREAQVNIFAMQALEIIGIVDEAFASELKYYLSVYCFQIICTDRVTYRILWGQLLVVFFGSCSLHVGDKVCLNLSTNFGRPLSSL